MHVIITLVTDQSHEAAEVVKEALDGPMIELKLHQTTNQMSIRYGSPTGAIFIDVYWPPANKAVLSSCAAPQRWSCERENVRYWIFSCDVNVNICSNGNRLKVLRFLFLSWTYFGIFVEQRLLTVGLERVNEMFSQKMIYFRKTAWKKVDQDRRGEWRIITNWFATRKSWMRRAT